MLAQMFYRKDYTQASVISALKAGRSDGVGPDGRQESDGLAIMNSGPGDPSCVALKTVEVYSINREGIKIDETRPGVAPN